MEIEKAKYLLKDYSNTTMNNTFIEAVNEVMTYIKELENKLNNKEKVYTIDQEEVILQITNMQKRLDNEEKKLESEAEKHISRTKRSKKLIEAEFLRARQQQCYEIIELIRSL